MLCYVLLSLPYIGFISFHNSLSPIRFDLVGDSVNANFTAISRRQPSMCSELFSKLKSNNSKSNMGKAGGTAFNYALSRPCSAEMC